MRWRGAVASATQNASFSRHRVPPWNRKYASELGVMPKSKGPAKPVRRFDSARRLFLSVLFGRRSCGGWLRVGLFHAITRRARLWTPADGLAA